MLARFREQLQGRVISGRSYEVEQESRPTCETCLACETRLACEAARPCEKTQAVRSSHMLAHLCEWLCGQEILAHGSEEDCSLHTPVRPVWPV